MHWVGDAATGFVRLIDQTRLPMEFVELDCRDVPAVWEAIKALAGPGRAGHRHRGGVRGGVRRAVSGHSRPGIDCPVARPGHRASPHQPTDRGQPVLGARPHGRLDGVDGRGRRGPAILDRLLAEARQIDEEDRAMCRAIGRHGAAWSSRGRGS